jgi:hypothetical protein
MLENILSRHFIFSCFLKIKNQLFKCDFSMYQVRWFIDDIVIANILLDIEYNFLLKLMHKQHSIFSFSLPHITQRLQIRGITKIQESIWCS